MKKIIISILIFCAITFHFVKVFKNSRKRVFNKKMEWQAKKTLRALIWGIIAVVFFVLAITNFSILRQIGFSLISEENILIIRSVMKVILGTESVYASLGILLCWTLISIEVSLLLSVISLFVVKKLLPIYFFEKEQLFFEASAKGEEQFLPVLFTNRKLIFSFARLRN
ncbi:MAG: hypothetical protein IKJ19_02895 [Clostridia bacterium]|nr:hypothetical protein [Clostridia bacterium]